MNTYAQRFKSLKERIWEKIPDRPQDGCWLWTAGRHPQGYGRIQVGNKLCLAHILIYEMEVGPITPGNEVCHTCDNPPCGRPDHLFQGTHAENMADCKKKGRVVIAYGEQHWKAKLTTTQVQEIMALKGHKSSGQASLIFHVSRTHIKRIWNKKSWKHLIFQ